MEPMLHALLRRKARRSVFEPATPAQILIAEGEIEEATEAASYEVNEDSLTAMVFGRLCYLPYNTLWRLLSDACTPPLAAAEGEIEERLFWPNLSLTLRDGALERRQPDLVVRCATADLIVEAKRRDGSDLQRSDQLARYWVAWQQLPEAQRSQKQLLLAVGGFVRITEGAVNALREQIAAEITKLGGENRDLSFHAMAWSSLRRVLETHRMNAVANERLLFEDVLSAFDLHEVIWRARLWFVSFPADVRNVTPLDDRTVPVINTDEFRYRLSTAPLWFAGFCDAIRTVSPLDSQAVDILTDRSNLQ